MGDKVTENIGLNDFVRIKSNGVEGVVVFDKPAGTFIVEEYKPTFDGELFCGLKESDLIVLEKAQAVTLTRH